MSIFSLLYYSTVGYFLHSAIYTYLYASLLSSDFFGVFFLRYFKLCTRFIPNYRFASFCFKWVCFFKSYDKRDDVDFDKVNFPFFDGDVTHRASYGVYISQIIWFARVCNNVANLSARNKC